MSLTRRSELEWAEEQIHEGDADSETVTATLQALSDKQAELETAMERWMELEAMAAGEA